MDIENKDEFIMFMKRAVECTESDSYIELYNILLRAFAKADVDYDGKVSVEEFPTMIKAADLIPNKFGFSWWGQEPKELFSKIDDNNDGAISFDEWLSFAMVHYKENVAGLPPAIYEMEKDQFVHMCKDAQNSGSDAFKQMYWFHWKCFQVADADRDGMVAGDEFDRMINKDLASLPLTDPLTSALKHSKKWTKMVMAAFPSTSGKNSQRKKSSRSSPPYKSANFSARPPTKICQANRQKSVKYLPVFSRFLSEICQLVAD